MITTLNGFKKCCIQPYNPFFFYNHCSIAANTTHIVLPAEVRQTVVVSPSPPQEQFDNNLITGGDLSTVNENMGIEKISISDPEPVPGCSYYYNQHTGAVNPTTAHAVCRNPEFFYNVSQRAILPIPKMIRNERRKNVKHGETAILASFPYKHVLSELQKIAQEKKGKVLKQDSQKGETIKTKQIKKNCTIKTKKQVNRKECIKDKKI